MDHDVFNTKLAVLLKRLKGYTGACTVRQNYRGRGRNKAQRQILVRWPDGLIYMGRCCEVWLKEGAVSFRPGWNQALFGPVIPIPPIQCEGKTEYEVYSEIEATFKGWLEC